MPINIEYNPEESIQIVRDVYGNPTTYRYDDRGNVLEVKNALGFSTFFEYDANNNLTQTRDANNLVTKYEYDTRGNLTSKTEAYCGCAGVVPGTTYYTYDARGQMQDLVLPTGASMHLSYDAHGNMLSMTDGKGGAIQSFTYYDNGLVKTETDTAGTTTYEYNNFGDVIKTIDNQQTTYTWNDENRLVGVDKADGKAIGYTYNINGIRVSSTVDGVTTQYLVDSNRDYAQVLEEYVDGVRSVSYVYGRDLISQERSSVTSFYLVDGLGSTTALTDASGNVTDTYAYNAFGEIGEQSGDTDNSYRFAGEQFDEELGEYYLRQRYYDAEIGRFTRRDSYEGSLFNSLTLHKYVYANDNPLMFVDPSGFIAFSTEFKVALAIIGLLYYLSPMGRDYSGGRGRSFDDYPTMDRAAIAAIREINPTSIRDNREYAGKIAKSLISGRYFYTRALPGTVNTSDPGFAPINSIPVADYHTHAAFDPDYIGEDGTNGNELPSPPDLNRFYITIPGTSIKAFSQVGYVGTPRGRIIKYSPRDVVGTTIDGWVVEGQSIV